jgi:hypothetical protein
MTAPLSHAEDAPPQAASLPPLARVPFLFWGVLLVLFGSVLYLLAIGLSLVRLALLRPDLMTGTIATTLWISGLPTTLGLLLVGVDLGLLLPRKRRSILRPVPPLGGAPSLTVALTAYDDEASIADAVRDFLGRPQVRRVIVVSNGSSDHTLERARAAGAIVHDEPLRGYGRCVHRCLSEAARHEDAELVALCEGDGTYRAEDLDKFLAYARHAEIVNGTRIVEQLRAYRTQLSTFMFYGNFFVGKLLEAKHLGRGTFTDVGTTYKIVRRESLASLLPRLRPSVNLEFNAHFLDVALGSGYSIVECPVTFHPRVGQSKGGNASNARALRVGARMMLGLAFGWRLLE